MRGLTRAQTKQPLAPGPSRRDPIAVDRVPPRPVVPDATPDSSRLGLARVDAA